MLGRLNAWIGVHALVSPARNATFSIAAFTLSALTAFVVSPIIIRTLGGASYGLLSMAGEFTAQFALFDLGIRGALTFFVAQGLARKDNEEVARTASTAIFVLAGLAALAATAAALLVYRLPVWFSLDGVPESEARLGVGILLLVFVLGFPMSIFSASLAAKRRHDLENLIAMVCSVASAVLSVVVLRVWGTLPYLAAAQAAGVVLRWSLQAYAVRKLSLGVSLLPTGFDGARAKELFSFGGANLLLNVASMVTLQADLVVIGRFAGASAAGLFQIGRYLGGHLFSLTGAITMTLGTNFTFHHTRDDQAAVRHLFLTASRYVSAIACLLAALIFVYGETFIALWAGPRFLNGEFWERGSTILFLMTAAMLARAMGSVCTQYLLGVRCLRLFTTIRVAEAAVSLVSSILLLNWLGLGGVALSKLTVTLVSHLLFIIPSCCRRLGIGSRQYAGPAIARPLLLLAGTGAWAILIRVMLPAASSWAAFFTGAAASFAGGVMLGWLLICTSVERDFIEARTRSWLA